MHRTCIAAVAVAMAVIGSVAGADLRPLEDAPLFAIQFVDNREGWACGADGVVWHSIDAGKHWERQPTGTRAVLRSLCFVDPYVGWAVGREELPDGGSNGIVMHTRDGGMKWLRLADGIMPGLNAVHFFDANQGVAVGDGTDRDPSGVWLTRDGGRTWNPAPGGGAPSWRCAAFRDVNSGILGGAWGRLAVVREGALHPADVDKLAARSVQAVCLADSRGVAVGQGGMVLLSHDSGGARWGFADLKLSAELLAGLDFQAACCQNGQIWIAGDPGSVIWHSPDFGRNWNPAPTGQHLPLHAVHFRDAANGWAVGDGGTILATSDGGRNWTVQRRGAQRAAACFIHGRSSGIPMETVACLGADDGYITNALLVTSADPISGDVRRSSDGDRWLAAQRRAGGSAATSMAAFRLSPQLLDAARADVIAEWDQSIRGSSSQRLAAILTQHIRTWRPEVVVTDGNSTGVDAVIADALKEAVERAGDPNAFPEQIGVLRLQPWAPKRLVSAGAAAGGLPMLNAAEPRRRLGDSLREFAAPAYALVSDGSGELPERRSFRAIVGPLPAQDLMAGVTLAYGGAARRPAPVEEIDPERVAAMEKATQERRNLQALSKPAWGKLSDSGALLAQIGPALAKLPADQGAAAAYSLANQYAQAGQWHLAREAFLLMVDRYPGHPLTANACRWLANYHSSSEARRREELGHFLVLTTTDVRQASGAPTRDNPIQAGGTVERPVAELTTNQQTMVLANSPAARRWFEGSLAVESRLAAFGPRTVEDPAVQFSFNAARRQLGDLDKPKSWARSFLMQPRTPGPQGSDPWRENAAGELWLMERNGPSPKPVANCRQTAVRPYLDGDITDECWTNQKPLVLKDPADGLGDKYETKAWLAYDSEYLYVALSCRHPADRFVPPVDRRTRDADLRPYDRVSLMLDLDRDYQTYFQWQIDQRGAVAEDCWGDRSWNPRWLVAHKSAANGWSAELAIPMTEITGDAVPLGKAWCINLVRVLPGRGVQAFSQPADARPRPEGMGLVIFTAK